MAVTEEVKSTLKRGGKRNVVTTISGNTYYVDGNGHIYELGDPANVENAGFISSAVIPTVARQNYPVELTEYLADKNNGRYDWTGTTSNEDDTKITMIKTIDQIVLVYNDLELSYPNTSFVDIDSFDVSTTIPAEDGVSDISKVGRRNYTCKSSDDAITDSLFILFESRSLTTYIDAIEIYGSGDGTAVFKVQGGRDNNWSDVSDNFVLGKDHIVHAAKQPTTAFERFRIVGVSGKLNRITLESIRLKVRLVQPN